MGTKPAKVGRRGPRCAKVRRGLHAAPTGASAKRSSIHAASKVVKSAPRADQSCQSGAVSGRGRVKSAKVRPQAASHKKVFAPQKRSSLRGRTKVAKVGPLRARVKSAKVRPTPYVYYPRVAAVRSSPIDVVVENRRTPRPLRLPTRIKIRSDCWVSRRYTTRDATQFRDAWAPHTQAQRHGVLAMMKRPLSDLIYTVR
jgi:hypothetical protein